MQDVAPRGLSQKLPAQFANIFDTHRLKKIDGSMVLDLPEWEWADFDGTRLVWVTGGVLYAGRIVPEGVTNTKPLFDFNSLTFKALKAPY